MAETETIVLKNDYDSQDCKEMTLSGIIADNTADVQAEAKKVTHKHHLVTITTIITITEDSYEHTGSEP